MKSHRLQLLSAFVVVLLIVLSVRILVPTDEAEAQDTATNDVALETTVASVVTVADTATLDGELRYQNPVEFVHRVDPVEVTVQTEVPIAPNQATADAGGTAGNGAATQIQTQPVQTAQTEIVETTTTQESFRTITGLPSQGQIIRFGEVLYETDSTPVILAPGDVAAWRTMTVGTSGEDVAQLQRFLVDGGHGDATLADDGVWAADTTTGVQVWQESTGQTASSSVVLGDIWFTSTPVRITEIAATVGIVVGDGEPVFSYTSTNRAVEASVAELPEGLLDAEELSARLPDGSEVEATLSSVRGTDEGFDLILEVDLFDADIADVNGLAITTTWVTSELVDSLTLPPEAIRRMEDGRYVVDVLDGDETRTVEVEVLGQAGRVVAVSGITEAELVVIP